MSTTFAELLVSSDVADDQCTSGPCYGTSVRWAIELSGSTITGPTQLPPLLSKSGGTNKQTKKKPRLVAGLNGFGFLVFSFRTVLVCSFGGLLIKLMIY